MSKSLADHRIHREARRVLTRHWIDLTRLAISSAQGVVRLVGRLSKLGPEPKRPFEPSQLDVLETELRRLPGVSRVHFDLVNWRKNSSGEWVALGAETSRRKDRGRRRA